VSSSIIPLMIQKIKLTNFRNFREKLFSFSPKTTVIIGDNATGKTNILESLFLISTGKSFHAHLEEEMIKNSEDIARVKGRVTSDESMNLEVILTRGRIEVGDDKFEKTPRKKLLVNGVSRRLIDFAGNFKVALFGPWDMDLVTGSPSGRRGFLDTVLSGVDWEYRRAILSYEKGLRQRNRLLWQIREYPSAGSGRMRLIFWNQLLIKNGDYISQKRQELIDFFNNNEPMTMHAKVGMNYKLSYDKSVISEARLEQYRDEEVAAATTLVGPHRDDFVFLIGESRKTRDLSRFGSRGEQRMAILWLKLCELAFVEAKTSEKPTLLLDDIFSELDHDHRAIVMEIVNNQQTLITTADPHFVENFKVSEKIKL